VCVHLHTNDDNTFLVLYIQLYIQVCVQPILGSIRLKTAVFLSPILIHKFDTYTYIARARTWHAHAYAHALRGIKILIF